MRAFERYVSTPRADREARSRSAIESVAAQEEGWMKERDANDPIDAHDDPGPGTRLPTG